jgi:hypothetical protein
MPQNTGSRLLCEPTPDDVFAVPPESRQFRNREVFLKHNARIVVAPALPFWTYVRLPPPPLSMSFEMHSIAKVHEPATDFSGAFHSTKDRARDILPNRRFHNSASRVKSLRLAYGVQPALLGSIRARPPKPRARRLNLLKLLRQNCQIPTGDKPQKRKRIRCQCRIWIVHCGDEFCSRCGRVSFAPRPSVFTDGPRAAASIILKRRRKTVVILYLPSN